MIKFWKSAAKGKTGCPVRPPETCSKAPDVKSLLHTQSVDENEDELHLFEKKSKLSLTLHDTLIEKKAIKYFIQYIETTEKHHLMKCWMDIENFKTKVINSKQHVDSASYKTINRTKSFDLHCKSYKQDEKFDAQRFSGKENSDTFSGACNPNTNEFSTSSCENLVEHTNSDAVDLTEEAISIFKTYVALEAPHQLDVPDSFRKSIITNICEPEGNIQECFTPLQKIIFSQLENHCFNEYICSPYYIKAQLDILTNGSLNLNDILFNETILFYFTEYLEQESCRVLLQFLMAVIHFRDNLCSDYQPNSEQTQADAIVIYDKYFSLQATDPVGFPTDIRLKIESEICREDGPLQSCFDLPYRIVFKTLTQYVKSFFESDLYYKYLSEMIHSVNQMWNSNHKSHSDCSSEFSISTQNTLLAMGDPVFRKKKRNLSVPDMTIDSNQLYNADSLWQRNRQDGLSLGRVNSLGRFESKFEPDPDKKDKSVLKKMVSRFVPSNTSKVEEEMAWQIAHMIVKDVTDLTMAPPDN
ncbi:putative A kinase anchor protein 10 [Operophtera brumata]|uniref:Putative A kinase anchor protein 10 n=1 Tax=Operophtera brumata TaxID=104452 RepID=A0A0L7L3L3_OPEBR|nr:putative A kinase anchor protein 10 [Operophtera brumata]